MAGISTLRQRRIDLCDKFAAKASISPRFCHWLPIKWRARATRSGAATAPVYEETLARCDRLRNSPLHFLRHRLNGKPGKIYGSRNKFWRERWPPDEIYAVYFISLTTELLVISFSLYLRQYFLLLTEWRLTVISATGRIEMGIVLGLYCSLEAADHSQKSAPKGTCRPT